MKHTSLHLGFTPYCTEGEHFTANRNSHAIPLRIHTLLRLGFTGEREREREKEREKERKTKKERASEREGQRES